MINLDVEIFALIFSLTVEMQIETVKCFIWPLFRQPTHLVKGHISLFNITGSNEQNYLIISIR